MREYKLGQTLRCSIVFRVGAGVVAPADWMLEVTPPAIAPALTGVQYEVPSNDPSIETIAPGAYEWTRPTDWDEVAALGVWTVIAVSTTGETKTADSDRFLVVAA